MALEFHWAWGQSDRLRALAAELVRRQVALIATSGTVSSLAAKAATTTIPIVFSTAADPIAVGLVESLNRPGGNATGVANLNVELGPKQLELLHELVPTATIIAVLVNPNFPLAESQSQSLQVADPKARAAAPCLACQHRERIGHGLCEDGRTARRCARYHS